MLGTSPGRPQSVGSTVVSTVAGGARRRLRRRLTAAALVVVVPIALLLGGGRLLDALTPSVSNPFSTTEVDRSGPVVLQALADLSDYHAATGTMQVLVDIEKDARFLPSFVSGEKTTLMAHGTVDAVADFRGLGSGAVRISEDRSAVTVVLPPVRLSEARVDPDQTRIVGTDRGLVNRIGGAFSADEPDRTRKLFSLAEQRIEDAVRDTDLRSRGEANTRATLEALLRTLGFTSVTVEFTPDPL